MYDSVSPSSPPSATAPPAANRSDSAVRAVFAATPSRTYAHTIYEQGSLRVRFPRSERCEAVLINTGGGITGGDILDVGMTIGANAHVVATSQAAEKLYRSDGPAARIAVRATLEDGAGLHWLPQESILFDGARVDRTIDVDMAPTAALTLLEAVVFGRIARGERIAGAGWHDSWRIRRGGRLILAEAVRLDGPINNLLQRPALGGGHRCLATLVHIGPDAESRLPLVRSALAPASSCQAASAWNGMLVARFAADAMHRLRADIVAATTAATGSSMPRAWSC